MAVRSTRTRGRRSRRAPAAKTAAGRLPVGTPSQPPAPHAHISVVPYHHHLGDSHRNSNDTPTFSSPSLQFDQNYSFTPTSDAATFADMARGYNKKDTEDLGKPMSSPMPLGTFVRLQPGRNRKGNKSWRPLQPSDYSGDADLELGSSSSPAEANRAQTRETSPKPSHLPTPQFPYQDVQADEEEDYAVPPDVSETATSDSAAMEGANPTVLPAGDVVENYIRLFGNLPDLIRLHEKTGDFDGQIIFIGHPNRDVSAHQWSSASFQWENIGHWSHTRSRIEGLLATERPSKSSMPFNSIEYFKAAAEQRGRTLKVSKPPPFLSEADRMASLSTLSGSAGDRSPTLTRADRSDAADARSAAYSSSQNITREQLEDPFVTPAKPPQPAIPASLNFGSAAAGPKGSMDLAYEFPARPAPGSSDYGMRKSNLASQIAYVQRKKERLDLEDLAREHENQVQLREISVGEEASGVAQPPQMNMHWPPLSFSPEGMRNHQQLKTQLAEPGGLARRPSQAPERRVVVPDVQMLNTNIRDLFPPGPTVANPYRGGPTLRGGSTLNANAAPYTGVPKPPVKRESQPSAAATAAVPPTNLGFSDPDSMRQRQAHEIANGLGRQAPTRQNFNGPFFTDAARMTLDPAALLSRNNLDKEELTKWFRDGQRATRQQEYAKSLVTAAVSSNKTRHLGVIGETRTKMQDCDKYEHTSFLVRALENMVEYAEESRMGPTSYFTRAWKPARPAMCDPSPDGNMSFFEMPASASPLIHLTPAHLGSYFRNGGGDSSTLRSQHSPLREGAFGAF